MWSCFFCLCSLCVTSLGSRRLALACVRSEQPKLMYEMERRFYQLGMVVCPRRQVSLCLERTVGRRPEVLVSSAILFGGIEELKVKGSAFARRAKKNPLAVEGCGGSRTQGIHRCVA